MYCVTALSFEQMTELIRNKKVSLDNGGLFFGVDDEEIDAYFKNIIGNSGYVLGLKGRLNSTTGNILSMMDTGIEAGNKLLLEVKLTDNDLIRYDAHGLTQAAEAYWAGLSPEDILEQLEEAKLSTESTNVEVLCLPYIKSNGTIRITHVYEDIHLEVEGITFIKLKQR